MQTHTSKQSFASNLLQFNLHMLLTGGCGMRVCLDFMNREGEEGVIAYHISSKKQLTLLTTILRVPHKQILFALLESEWNPGRIFYCGKGKG